MIVITWQMLLYHNLIIMEEYIVVRKGIEFRKGSAEKVTLKRWLFIYGEVPYLNEGEAEKLYYQCGGKKTAKSEKSK